MERNEVSFRYAEIKDIPLIFQFVRKLADYEQIPEAVFAT